MLKIDTKTGIDTIYIPTFKRHDKQIFFESLPDRLKDKVIFVIQKQEEHLFSDKNTLVVDNNIGIAKTREIIYKTAGKKRYLVVDDDVLLYRRNAKYFGKPSNMEGAKRPILDNEWNELLQRLNDQHDSNHILCGFKFSLIIPRRNQPIFNNSAIFAIFSIDGEQLSKIIDEIDFNYVPIQEDIYFNLELLTRGYPNAIMEEFCYFQRYNKPGGCSSFRTRQMEDDCAEKLNKKFPKYYKINYSKPRTAMDTLRTTVQYAKAYKESQ